MVYSIDWTRLVSAGLALYMVRAATRALWNAVFSPLASIPGPRLAAVTDWWLEWHALSFRRGATIHEAFQKYGPIVRIGPNKVAFSHLEDVYKIYRSEKFVKSDWYKGFTFGGRDNAFNTRDPVFHAKVRRWSAPALGGENLRNAAVHMNEVIGHLVDRIKNESRTGEPIDVLHLFKLLGLDIAYLPPLLYQTLKYLPLRHLQKIFAADSGIIALGSELYDANIEGGTDFVSTAKAYRDPTTGMPPTREEVVSESASVLDGGTDTISIALTYAAYEVALNRSFVQEIRSELEDNRVRDLDLDALKELPYLNAFLKEVMRVHGPAPSFLERVVPTGGAVLGGKTLPAGTAWSFHRDVELFPEPLRVMPERWVLKSPGGQWVHRHGVRACTGRPLAELELLLVTVAIVTHFDIALHETTTPSSMDFSSCYSSTFASLLSLCLLLPAALALVPDWTPPLSTSGRYVVDARGQRFKLKSANWHGASGTWNGSGDKNDDSTSHAGENSHGIPLGLQYVPIDEMLDSFEQLGINSIRLPFSNEMLHDANPVPDEWVAANPQFRGKAPRDIYEAVVNALTDRRFAVILNNHTNKSRWCCGIADGNERWNESQSEEQWIQDWVTIVRRFKDNKRVVGADLYNEVRRDILNDPNWGGYNSYDWYLAAHRAGDRILTEANPDILIVIEGINWVGIPTDITPHSRPTLVGANQLSHTLVQPNKLVYSAHFYSYTGPNHSGASGIGVRQSETTDPRYEDLSKSDLYNTYIDSAAFVALNKDRHYNAPLWMSEFGVHGIGGVPDVTRAWWDNTLAFLISNDIDFAYWPLVGFRDTDNLWALINWDRKSKKRDGLLDGNDWRKDSFLSLTNATYLVTPPTVDRWRMLNLDVEDYVKSAKMLAKGDWDNGARKAACPDGLRLIGLSAGSPARGLCTDASFSATWSTAETVYDERNVKSDWASTFTKYQCADDSFVIGYAVRGAKVSTVLCAKSDKSLGKGSSRTVWFDQGDNRGDALGGDFANKQYKGQCNRDEYVAGVAFTTAWLKPGVPAAILCRK
ncbi:cytochrome P450 [Auricularia subglabra TFB-10046 SS5]|nr:cytochrome P450 [Auricularia subglabra TFB-10046 SS5]